MEIGESYRGPKSVIVTERLGLYHFDVADSGAELDDKIRALRSPPRIVVRYDGVNDDSILIIDRAVRDLDAGDSIDLSKLLS